MNIEELKRQLLEQGITEEDLKKDKEKNKKQGKEIKEIEETTKTKVRTNKKEVEETIDKIEEVEENQKKYIEEVLDEKIAKTLNQNIRYVRNVLKMIEEGNTIPFIARYRKE